MGQLLKQSFKQIKCEVSGHLISQGIQVKLFNERPQEDYVECERCGAELLLKVNPKNKDEYFITDY